MGSVWEHLFAAGSLAVRPGPAYSYDVSRAVARGEMVRVLPGVYCVAGTETHIATRCAAVMASDPNAVITGAAAAAITWWPEREVDVVQAYRRRPVPVRGFRWLAGATPEGLVHRARDLNVATAALAVLDMIPRVGGQAIDEALRRRCVTLAELEAALQCTPHRKGNPERRWLLDDSRDEPWSELERSFHRRFRALGLPYGYHTNHRVDLGDGRHAFLDLALPELMVGFEVDGFAHHSSRGAFEADRTRDARLTALGWVVVRFTWAMVEHDPDGVELAIRRVVAARRAQLGVS